MEKKQRKYTCHSCDAETPCIIDIGITHNDNVPVACPYGNYQTDWYEYKEEKHN